MRVLLSLVALAGLVSCNRAAKDAEAQYEIVRQRGSSEEKCAAASKAADAWLEAENKEKYEQWKSKRDTVCLFASLRRGY